MLRSHHAMGLITLDGGVAHLKDELRPDLHQLLAGVGAHHVATNN
jgi:hypothetical protein